MVKFGYLTDDNDKVGGALSPNSPEFQASIRRLQRFGNIPVTGKIDTATIKLINTDRCGLKDSSNSVMGRFNLQGTIWKKRVSSNYKLAATQCVLLEIHESVRFASGSRKVLRLHMQRRCSIPNGKTKN